MKDTKRTFKIGLVVALAAAAIILSGCATAEKPNYRGHKGVSPTVYDYYPNTSQR